RRKDPAIPGPGADRGGHAQAGDDKGTGRAQAGRAPRLQDHTPEIIKQGVPDRQAAHVLRDPPAQHPHEGGGSEARDARTDPDPSPQPNQAPPDPATNGHHPYSPFGYPSPLTTTASTPPLHQGPPTAQ